jgi:hypothetical protein
MMEHVSIIDDNRHAGRIRSFLRGEIVHSNGASRTECTVRDISETGARIQVPKSVTLPEFFELIIPQKGMHERARIIWIKDGEIGVTFAHNQLNGQSDGPHQADLAHRIHILESEVYRLRLDLKDMQERLASSEIKPTTP